MPRPRTVDLRWNAILNDFRRSGLTQAEFCRRRDISLHSFRKRLYSPRPSRADSLGAPPAAAAAPHFVPVAIRPDPSPSISAPPSHLELVLTDGRRIAVAPGFDPQTLRRLLAVLEEAPCSD
jgi:transposase